MVRFSANRWLQRSTEKVGCSEENPPFCHPLVAALLRSRGIDTQEGMERFLHPRLADLPDPEHLSPDIAAGAELVADVLISGERIEVHGDYDVDGVTGTALLVRFLRDCGGEVGWHIPHRERDGYGLSQTAVEAAAARGTTLIITVDCGITASAAAETARNAGIRLVVTDHHHPPAELPVADALINPLLGDAQSSLRPLAGVGVAFFLVIAVRSRLRRVGRFETVPEPDLRKLLELVALGSVADVVPLVGVNRVLVATGLHYINASPSMGVAALKEVADASQVICSTISFQLAPRLNAAGRIGDGGRGVDLLLSEESGQAGELAACLDATNRERQTIERDVQDEAYLLVDTLAQERHSIVLHGAGWHPGVIGIVAGRVAEEFFRPTVLFAGEGVLKGSVRSIPGLDLTSVLDRCSDHIMQWGGHRFAAGLTLRAEQLPCFTDAFDSAVNDIGADLLQFRDRLFDLSLSPAEMTLALALELERLAPFGPGNPEPVFRLPGIRPRLVQLVGKEHVRFQCGDVPAIAFQMASRMGELDKAIDLFAVLKVNRWRGAEGVQLQVKDWAVLVEKAP